MREFAKKHKYHLILFITLLLTTAISGWYALATTSPLNTEYKTNEPNNTNNSTTTTQKIPTKNTAEIKQQTITSSSPTNKKPAAKNKDENKIFVNCQQNCLNSKIKIAETTYNLQLTATTTAYNAMLLLQQNASLDFKSKDYGSLGFLIEEINGIKNGQQNKYWVYYINDESAKVGISSYIIRSNDIITWKYIKI